MESLCRILPLHTTSHTMPYMYPFMTFVGLPSTHYALMTRELVAAQVVGSVAGRTSVSY